MIVTYIRIKSQITNNKPQTAKVFGTVYFSMCSGEYRGPFDFAQGKLLPLLVAESTGVEPVSPEGHEFSKLAHYRPAHSPSTRYARSGSMIQLERTAILPD